MFSIAIYAKSLRLLFCIFLLLFLTLFLKINACKMWKITYPAWSTFAASSFFSLFALFLFWVISCYLQLSVCLQRTTIDNKQIQTILRPKTSRQNPMKFCHNKLKGPKSHELEFDQNHSCLKKWKSPKLRQNETQKAPNIEFGFDQNQKKIQISEGSKKVK